MELPISVLVHNQVMGLKGSAGNLLSISPNGYYEINLKFGDKMHRVLLPISETVIISQEAEVKNEESIEVER